MELDEGMLLEHFSEELTKQILDDYEKARKYDNLKEDYDELVLEYKEECTRSE